MIIFASNLIGIDLNFPTNIMNMKKILLSIAVLFLTVYYVNAQSFTLEWNGYPYNDGDTITVTPDLYSSAEILFEPILNNNTNSGINIEVIRDEITLIEGSVNYFCWDTCYESSVDTSLSMKYIPAGGSSIIGDFAAHYEINETIGISIIAYKFYNKSNPDEHILVFVEFDTYPTGVDDNLINNIWISEVYPNPASMFVNIDYDIPNDVEEASIKIVNMFGIVVKEQGLELGSNHKRMNISELSGGIYFYLLSVNGEMVTTKKLIIR